MHTRTNAPTHVRTCTFFKKILFLDCAFKTKALIDKNPTLEIALWKSDSMLIQYCTQNSTHYRMLLLLSKCSAVQRAPYQLACLLNMAHHHETLQVILAVEFHSLV